MPQTSPPSLSSDVPSCPSVSEVLAASDESPSDDQVKTELRRTSNWSRNGSSAKESRGSEQALHLAADVKCDICFHRQRPTPIFASFCTSTS